MGIGRFAFTPILPMMQREGLLSVAGGGWLATANYLGYFAGSLSAIFIRLPPARAIRMGLAAIALTTLAMGLDEHMASWIAYRTIAGIASAWVLVYGSAWTLEHLASAARPELGGIVFTGVGIGIAAAGLACLALMQFDSTSTTAWIALGALAMLLDAAIWTRFEDFHAQPPTAGEAHRVDLRGFTKLTLCYGALGFGYIVPATFLPAMARQALPDPMIFGWTWPIFGAAAAASTLVAAAIARRIGYRRLWIAANLVMAVGVALPVLSAGVAALLVSAILVGGTFVVITLAGLQEARRSVGARARELIASMTCAFAFGQVAGPVVVALLAARGGYAVALASASAALTLSAIALAFD